MTETTIVGPGRGCFYCGEVYGQHFPDCKRPMPKEKKKRPKTNYKTISEHCCMKCDYDEAEGGLIRHCPKCMEWIVKTLWKVTHK